MKDDAIVEEVRKVREALFAEFDYDLAAYVKHLQQKTEEARRSGRTVVPPQARRIGLPASKSA